MGGVKWPEHNRTFISGRTKIVVVVGTIQTELWRWALFGHSHLPLVPLAHTGSRWA